MSGRSHEPLFWSLFAAGGVLAALFVPVFILVSSLLGPFGWDWFADAFAYEGVRDLLEHGLVRAAVGAVVALIAVHACHRLRHLAVDLHAPLPGTLISLVAYGGAAAVAVLTAVFLALV
ncbi:MAG: fumarate reductase subunit D [Chloroflexota bacterium]|nr:fumarate reductase subunit D [Chloroflexota bacterium]MDE2920643.1 fumarate reductase subunit D [Chloroflexota bacterium]